MDRKWMLGAALLALVAAGAWWATADEPAPNPKSALMKQKLEHAQKLLAGLAMQDFKVMERQADELSLLSKKAEWRVVATPEYARHSEEMRRSCADIVKAAQKKNIDGAMLGYLKLTTNCVECHKHLRETKIAGLAPAGDPLAAAGLVRN